MRIKCEKGCSEGWVRGSLIGAGAFGTVNLAVNKSNGELFAVKSMASDFISCLKNEYDILRSLDSPYIVRCLGMDESVENGGGVCNLLMEYMPGGNMADLVAKFGGRLEESVIRAYTGCILRGLEYLHRKGIVHCDIKGKNLLVGKGGVKIADFGSAKMTADKWIGIMDPLKLRGTPLWMAPEVINQVEQGPPSDIWSLGCTVVEMATGRPPWGNVSNPVAAMYRIGCTDELPEIPQCLSQQARDFLEKCFRKDPMQRWSAEQLLKHPFLSEDGCSVSAPLSPSSALDLGHPVWDSYSSNCSRTLRTSLLDTIRPAGEADSEGENKSAEKNYSLRSSPKGRIMALASGCQKPDWCSTPPAAGWIVVRSTASTECHSKLETSDSKNSQSGLGGEAFAEQNWQECDELPLGLKTSLIEQVDANSGGHNRYAAMQNRVLVGKFVQNSAIQRGKSFSFTKELHSKTRMNLFMYIIRLTAVTIFCNFTYQIIPLIFLRQLFLV